MRAPISRFDNGMDDRGAAAASAYRALRAGGYGPNGPRVEAFLQALRTLSGTQWRQVRDAAAPSEQWARAFLEPTDDIGHAAGAAVHYASLAAGLTAVWMAAYRSNLEVALDRAAEAAREAASGQPLGDPAAAKTAAWALICQDQLTEEQFRFLYRPFAEVLPAETLGPPVPGAADPRPRQLALLGEPEGWGSAGLDEMLGPSN